MKKPWALKHAGWIVTVGIVTTIVVLGIGVFWAPSWSTFTVPVSIDARDADPLGAARLRSDQKTAVREGAIKLAAGVGAAFAVVLAWGRLELSKQQQELAEQSHYTERYTRAVDQLGSAEQQIKLGGIYALERLTKDSPADKRTIIEVLCAFIRSTTPTKQMRPSQHAALIVVTRSSGELDLDRADLSDVTLSKPIFRTSSLSRTNFSYAALLFADFKQCVADSAKFEHASAQKALFDGSSLHQTCFDHADLNGASFIGCELTKARFVNAELIGANLSRVIMKRAILNDAMIDGVCFDGADLSGAVLNATTVINSSFNDEFQAAGAEVNGAVLDQQAFDALKRAGATIREPRIVSSNNAASVERP